MAQGSATEFEELALSIADGRINLATDTIRIAFTNTVPLATAAVPTWGVGGTTDISANEVTAGGGYTATGQVLGTKTFTKSGNVSSLDGDDSAWVSAGVGDPTDIVTAIVYSDTATNKDCIGFLDMTADAGTTPISLLTGDISIGWAAAGVLTITV